MRCPFLFPSVSFQNLKETLETRTEENEESTRTFSFKSGNRVVIWVTRLTFSVWFTSADQKLSRATWSGKAELNLVRASAGWHAVEALSAGWHAVEGLSCGVARCGKAFCRLQTIAVCCFKCMVERPSHPIVCIQSMTHKWVPWDMGRSVCKANQRILFSLPRGGVGVGVRSREPEGSLVKICSRIAETLLTFVMGLHFSPRSTKASSNRSEGSVELRGEKQDY